MKILQVIPYFVPAYSYGGPVKVCFDISIELAKRGHEITVATTDTLDKKKRISKLEEHFNGLRIIRFRNISNQLAKNCNGYLPIGFYSWAKNNIRTFDAVHCHDFFTYQNIVIAHFCKKYSIPYLIQPHGTLSPVRQNTKFKRTKKIFLKLFDKVLRNSKNIIALTENEKREIISIDRKFEEKTTVIPNGLKLENFENIKKTDLYKKYDIPKENKIIGYIGRLQYIKGVDISLEVLSQLKNRIKFTYLIIGPDEGERKNLEKKVVELKLQNSVIFAGMLSGQKKLETIKSCNLFLFTSRNEGLPMTVLEVAALGIPQILSKSCNVPEIEKYGAGFEIELSKKNFFADKIMDILSGGDREESFYENSRKMITDCFSLNVVCNKIENLMK